MNRVNQANEANQKICKLLDDGKPISQEAAMLNIIAQNLTLLNAIMADIRDSLAAKGDV